MRLSKGPSRCQRPGSPGEVNIRLPGLNIYAPRSGADNARTCRESRGPSAKLMTWLWLWRWCATCVSIERIRRDRVLREALTRRADPVYLALVSSLSLHLTQPLTG